MPDGQASFSGAQRNVHEYLSHLYSSFTSLIAMASITHTSNATVAAHNANAHSGVLFVCTSTPLIEFTAPVVQPLVEHAKGQTTHPDPVAYLP